jgi:hypothetical protein
MSSNYLPSNYLPATYLPATYLPATYLHGTYLHGTYLTLVIPCFKFYTHDPIRGDSSCRTRWSHPPTYPSSMGPCIAARHTISSTLSVPRLVYL